VPAGRRSGKTELAKRKVCQIALTADCGYDQNFYFCGAPTRDQAKRIYWADIKALTKPFWRKPPQETSLEVYTRFDGIESTIQVVGLDKPERMEGSPWNGGVIDEMRKIKPHTWGQHIRPALSDREGWCWRCGVPEGRNHYYEMAILAGGGLPVTIPGEGAFSQGEDLESAYYSWHSADILPEKEIESARRELDPQMFRQEYEGSFESYEGLVYYAYKPTEDDEGNLDSRIKYNPNIPVAVGMDFNVSPMTAWLGHVVKDKLLIFKDYLLQNSNTQAMIDRILNDTAGSNSYTIVSCHSGSARQTSADIGRTDRKIIENAIRARGKAVLMRHRTRNPQIMARIHSVNCALSSRKLMIHPSCKEIAKDFDTLVYKEGSSDIDESDKMRKHISDAVGYFVERFWPVTKNIDLSEYDNFTF